ncbi:hypothetical protein, partial [Mycobacterium marinum]|uniref:hypothetical protein n=1 Tax=Mycobacterium marinum TaxID=1781 RepID=UPI0021C25E88
ESSAQVTSLQVNNAGTLGVRPSSVRGLGFGIENGIYWISTVGRDGFLRYAPLTICGTGDFSLSRLPIAPDRGCGDSWSAACLVRSGVGEGLAGQPNFSDARTLLGEYPLCYSRRG